MFEEYRKEQRRKEIESTGISGYCNCCGAPNYVTQGQKHDPECHYYPSAGGDLGSTGAESKWRQTD